MKIFISADIEGINGIHSWSETELNNALYARFQKQMTQEVAAAARAAKDAGATQIVVKDAHDSAMNLILEDLPTYVELIRGWEGGLCGMMTGLDASFDACLFIGYHSPVRSDGNTLAHTMSTDYVDITCNNKPFSEFQINTYYAQTLGVPVVFVSGDESLTKLIQSENKNIHTVATKSGMQGASRSKHPAITNQEIYDTVYSALKQDLNKDYFIPAPTSFDIKVQYPNTKTAYNNSFFPKAELVNTDTIRLKTKKFQDVLVFLKFV